MATFWEIAARLAGHVFSLSFVYLYFYLFPILVIRAGLRFLLLQFLFIAFLLLLTDKHHRTRRGQSGAVVRASDFRPRGPWFELQPGPFRCDPLLSTG